jgi:hypothetical protein
MKLGGEGSPVRSQRLIQRRSRYDQAAYSLFLVYKSFTDLVSAMLICPFKLIPKHLKASTLSISHHARKSTMAGKSVTGQ